jgi:hypothetical protein
MNNLSNELPVISADLAALRCDAPTSGLARRRLLPATPASAAADGVHLDQQVPVAWSAFVSWHVISFAADQLCTEGQPSFRAGSDQPDQPPLRSGATVDIRLGLFDRAVTGQLLHIAQSYRRL